MSRKKSDQTITRNEQSTSTDWQCRPQMLTTSSVSGILRSDGAVPRRLRYISTASLNYCTLSVTSSRWTSQTEYNNSSQWRSLCSSRAKPLSNFRVLIADDAGDIIHHSLQLVCCDPRRPGQLIISYSDN